MENPPQNDTSPNSIPGASPSLLQPDSSKPNSNTPPGFPNLESLRATSWLCLILGILACVGAFMCTMELGKANAGPDRVAVWDFLAFFVLPFFLISISVSFKALNQFLIVNKTVPVSHPICKLALWSILCNIASVVWLFIFGLCFDGATVLVPFLIYIGAILGICIRRIYFD